MFIVFIEPGGMLFVCGTWYETGEVVVFPADVVAVGFRILNFASLAIA